jgi:hypothetical protein
VRTFAQTGERNSFFCYWRDGELVQTDHWHYYTADDGYRAVDRYEYDEDENEVYVRTGAVIMDDF